MTNPVFLKMKQTYSATTQSLSKNDRLSTITDMMAFLSDELKKLNEPTVKPKTIQQIASEQKEKARDKFSSTLLKFHSNKKEEKADELLKDGWKQSFVAADKSEMWFYSPKQPGIKLILKADGTVRTQPINKQ